MTQIKLHLGSARRRLKGFINIDREYSEGIDLVADVSDLSAFKDSMAYEIYTSHTVEYFDREQVRAVLLEWRRVLCHGGKLFVSVPDFERLIDIYRDSGDIARVLGPLFGRWRNETNGETLYHKTVWDFQSLSACLQECGYESIERFDPAIYLSSIDPEFDDYSLAFYPHMDRSGIPVSLCLKATANKL
jgi:SAM-dependent methyltransferase